MNRQKVIAVDLDGTLAVYDGWKGPSHIGEPIERMVRRVRRWLAEGHKIVIFTARITNDADDTVEEDRITEIRNWLDRAKLPRNLDITNVKQKAFAEMWDDRAIRVTANHGDISGQAEIIFADQNF